MARHIKKTIQGSEALIEGDHYHHCQIVMPWEGRNVSENICLLNCDYIPEVYYLINLVHWIRG